MLYCTDEALVRGSRDLGTRCFPVDDGTCRRTRWETKCLDTQNGKLVGSES